MELILIRGLPGAGKSTAAKKMLADNLADRHFEADMWVDYSLPFEKRAIKTAHEICQQETKKALSAGLSVVVSNTFTRQWEVEPYLEIARMIGAEVEIYTVTGEFKNVHGVPDEAIAAMRDRWEEI